MGFLCSTKHHSSQSLTTTTTAPSLLSQVYIGFWLGACHGLKTGTFIESTNQKNPNVDPKGTTYQVNESQSPNVDPKWSRQTLAPTAYPVLSASNGYEWLVKRCPFRGGRWGSASSSTVSSPDDQYPTGEHIARDMLGALLKPDVIRNSIAKKQAVAERTLYMFVLSLGPHFQSMMSWLLQDYVFSLTSQHTSL